MFGLKFFCLILVFSRMIHRDNEEEGLGVKFISQRGILDHSDKAYHLFGISFFLVMIPVISNNLSMKLALILLKTTKLEFPLNLLPLTDDKVKKKSYPSMSIVQWARGGKSLLN